MCSQLKFYSVDVILNMAEILKEKWIYEEQKDDESISFEDDANESKNNNENLDIFVDFKHTSPYVI